MLEEVKKQIIKFGRIAGDRNLTSGFSGNISIKSGNQIVITSSGSANSFLEEQDLCVVDLNGNLIDGNKKPSSEKFLHIEFYKRRNDINAVCHFHCPYLMAFALAGKGITDKISPEIIYGFGEIPLAEYALPGSKELADNTAKYFETYDVVLMENHGVIAGGKDIKDAYLKLELCENYAKSLVLSKFLGGAKILTKEQVKEVELLKAGNK